MRSLPPHFRQGAGKILRPGSGCRTDGKPVPLQASHSNSMGRGFFMPLRAVRSRTPGSPVGAAAAARSGVHSTREADFNSGEVALRANS
jgi:hypothetical protein